MKVLAGRGRPGQDWNIDGGGKLNGGKPEKRPKGLRICKSKRGHRHAATENTGRRARTGNIMGHSEGRKGRVVLKEGPRQFRQERRGTGKLHKEHLSYPKRGLLLNGYAVEGF